MSKPRISNSQQQGLALERISKLFQQADYIFHTDKDLAHHYVSLARKIAMKVRISLPAEYRRKFCHHCYKYLMPGINSRIRTSKGKVIISCFECKKFMRIPIKNKRSKHKK
jgi:ribonuclease P protein subunit RPR2